MEGHPRVADHLRHVGEADRLAQVELGDLVIECVPGASDLDGVGAVPNAARMVPEVHAVDGVRLHTEALECAAPGDGADPTEASDLEYPDLLVRVLHVRFDQRVDHRERDGTSRDRQRRGIEARTLGRDEVQPDIESIGAPRKVTYAAVLQEIDPRPGRPRQLLITRIIRSTSRARASGEHMRVHRAAARAHRAPGVDGVGASTRLPCSPAL